MSADALAEFDERRRQTKVQRLREQFPKAFVIVELRVGFGADYAANLTVALDEEQARDWLIDHLDTEVGKDVPIRGTAWEFAELRDRQFASGYQQKEILVTKDEKTFFWGTRRWHIEEHALVWSDL